MGQQKDKVVQGVKEPTRMQDWHHYWSWEKDDKCRSRCSGAELFRGRGAFRVFSHPTLLGATILLLCCDCRIFGLEGAGCITSLSTSVPYSPWKTSYRSYEWNTCHYLFITGIFLSLYTKQKEYFSYTSSAHQGECHRTRVIHLTAPPA